VSIDNDVVLRSPTESVASYSGTGEHGVGVGKKEYLPDELGEGTVELMRNIKRAIDPLNLFNPGKVNTQTAIVPRLLCSLVLLP